MVDIALPLAILDSLADPILVADTEHMTRYMNSAAAKHYPGGESLLGRSLLDCHGPRSQQIIRDVVAAMQAGENERLISDRDGRRHYMIAVRSREGRLLGYYERVVQAGS